MSTAMSAAVAAAGARAQRLKDQVHTPGAAAATAITAAIAAAAGILPLVRCRRRRPVLRCMWRLRRGAAAAGRAGRAGGAPAPAPQRVCERRECQSCDLAPPPEDATAAPLRLGMQPPSRRAWTCKTTQKMC